MYIILLKFSDNKNQAGSLMEDHKAWIRRGLDDGVFLLVGSLQPNDGGAILAHNTTLDEIQRRVKEDPFVEENVVTAETLEVAPAMADDRMKFLLA